MQYGDVPEHSWAKEELSNEVHANSQSEVNTFPVLRNIFLQSAYSSSGRTKQEQFKVMIQNRLIPFYNSANEAAQLYDHQPINSSTSLETFVILSSAMSEYIFIDPNDWKGVTNWK